MQLVHRDVSPQNILVTRAGRAKVIDFGIAKARGRLAQTTETGVVRGKRAYMSPEQAFGETVDRRADVWAMGAVVFRTLVGRPLFEETGSFRAYIKGTLAPALPAAIPEPVRALVLRALALAPEDRCPTNKKVGSKTHRSILAAARDNAWEIYVPGKSSDPLRLTYSEDATAKLKLDEVLAAYKP